MAGVDVSGADVVMHVSGADVVMLLRVRKQSMSDFQLLNTRLLMPYHLFRAKGISFGSEPRFVARTSICIPPTFAAHS